MTQPLLQKNFTAVISLLSLPLAGILVTLSLAPYNISTLGIAATAIVSLHMRSNTSARQAAFRAWLFGCGLFGSGASWVYVSIHIHGNASIPLAIALTVIFCAGLALIPALVWYGFGRWFSATKNFYPVAFAATWVLEEWIRGWILTGFPWLYLGYGHIDSILAGWAPISGVLGISFIIAFSGSAITLALTTTNPLRFIPIVAAVIAWATGALLDKIQWVEIDHKEPMHVAIVQANIPQQEKWRSGNLLPTLELYRQLSAPLWANNNLVIWPEAAIPARYQRVEEYIQTITQQAKKYKSTLITGIPTQALNPITGNTESFNSVMALGNGSGKYNKQKLVPFGEYVPLENFLRGVIDFFDMPSSHMQAGQSRQHALLVDRYLIAPFICYEIAYADLVAREHVSPHYLLTVSNDAWFGASIGPLQHLQISQMRALENQRYLIRSTGTGISAFIDPNGKIIAKSKQFEREILRNTIYPASGSTPFSQTGSLPIVVLSIIGLLLSRAKPQQI